jgi:hypothetical protein
MTDVLPLLDILTVQPTPAGGLRAEFSDATAGEFDASWLEDKSGSLLVALRDPAFFARAFVDGGGLCWPNGLELSAATVQAWLRAQGRLQSPPRAA